MKVADPWREAVTSSSYDVETPRRRCRRLKVSTLRLIGQLDGRQQWQSSVRSRLFAFLLFLATKPIVELLSEVGSFLSFTFSSFFNPEDIFLRSIATHFLWLDDSLESWSRHRIAVWHWQWWHDSKDVNFRGFLKLRESFQWRCKADLTQDTPLYAITRQHSTCSVRKQPKMSRCCYIKTNIKLIAA